MTKDEWAKAEETLTHLYGHVTFIIDGYKVEAILERAGVYTNKIMVYVNEKFLGKWLSEDCEERRRFMNATKKKAFTAKMKKDFEKKFGKLRKKELKEIEERYTIVIYSPQFSSFSALKKKFVDNNKEIGLVDVSG